MQKNVYERMQAAPGITGENGRDWEEPWSRDSSQDHNQEHSGEAAPVLTAFSWG